MAALDGVVEEGLSGAVMGGFSVVMASFSAAVLCDVRGVARQFDEDVAELLLLGARLSMVALLPAVTLLQRGGAC